MLFVLQVYLMFEYFAQILKPSYHFLAKENVFLLLMLSAFKTEIISFVFGASKVKSSTIIIFPSFAFEDKADFRASF